MEVGGEWAVSQEDKACRLGIVSMEGDCVCMFRCME